MDALNEDPDYTSLLNLLQKARLIPTLNRLNGSTLFAPTNDAIKRHSFWTSIHQDLNDNAHEKGGHDPLQSTHRKTHRAGGKNVD